MNFKIKNSTIFISQRLLENEYFNNLFCNAICCLFSFEIDQPRILIRCGKNFFQKIASKLQKNCEICLKNGLEYEKFCLCTHFCEFDLGLFVAKKSENYCIKLVSGSGKELSQTKISILEKYFKNESLSQKHLLKKFKINKKNDKIFSNIVHSKQLQKLNNWI